jgi:RNA polymerase sigma factor (sigma-70 family)
MRQDPENGKDSDAGAPVESRAAAFPLLASHVALVDRLFSESDAAAWGVSRERFQVALERSASKQFGSAVSPPSKLEEFLGALHVKDLALAVACAEGGANAWDHFVGIYRGYLRTAAGAILRCSATSAAACDLADSLFAELYGLTEGKRADHSLFRYFHGRSSLKTWLRAVLAQRHIDAIRVSRRFTELEEETGDASGSEGQAVGSQSKVRVPRIASPPDPHRERYVALLTSAFEAALQLLDSRDRERLRLYYAESQTLAEIGRALGEHESSVSRNLDRIRRDLRLDVEAALRNGRGPVNGAPAEPGLSEEQIGICFQYASEDAPIDLEKLFPRSAQQQPKSTRQQR